MNGKTALLIGAGLGVGTAAGVTLNALPVGSSGDLVYRTDSVYQSVTPAQARCFVQCAQSAALWAGNASDVTKTCLQSDERGGFQAFASGKIAVSPDSIPVGVKVIGRVP